MNTLIFIDTNIFLDFYGMGNNKIRMSLLEKINNNQDKIITSNQVEMEYKKNRQRVIFDFLNNRMKKIDLGDMSIGVLASNSISKSISKKETEIKKKQEELKEKIIAMLKNPLRYDPVYKALNKLFKNKCEYNLSKDKKIIDKIKRLALKRFYLGYPPRKNKDTSIGDAINWEWIIYCAKKSKKDIIIVSRDKDYGIVEKDMQILNDWLLEEFKSRVSRRRKIILTKKLTKALEEIEVEISEDEKQEEEKVINETESIRFQYPNLSLGSFAEIKELQDSLSLPVQQYARIIEELQKKFDILLKPIIENIQKSQSQIIEELQNTLKITRPSNKKTNDR